jgi:hypothetical protein
MTPREIGQEIVKKWGEQIRGHGSPDLAGLIADAITEAVQAQRGADARIASEYALAVLDAMRLDASEPSYNPKSYAAGVSRGRKDAAERIVAAIRGSHD